MSKQRSTLASTFGKQQAKELNTIIQQAVKDNNPDAYVAAVVEAAAAKLETEAILKEMLQAETITPNQYKNALARPDRGAAMAQAELKRRAGTLYQNQKEQESEMIYKEMTIDDFLQNLRGETKEKQAPATPATTMWQAHYPGVGVLPINGGQPATATKEAGQDANILDGIFGLNQAYGKPASKTGNILDGLFQLNQQYGKGEKR